MEIVLVAGEEEVADESLVLAQLHFGGVYTGRQALPQLAGELVRERGEPGQIGALSAEVGLRVPYLRRLLEVRSECLLLEGDALGEEGVAVGQAGREPRAASARCGSRAFGPLRLLPRVLHGRDYHRPSAPIRNEG